MNLVNDNYEVNRLKKKSRNYGIDLLRCVSMFMIIILHILGEGGILDNSQLLSSKHNIAWLLEVFCFSAVNIYAMITGFVMINSKFKLGRIIEIWLQVLFYSLGITLIFYFTTTDIVSVNDIKKSIFPICNKYYWYATAYFGMYFFVNFINKALNALSKRDHKKLLIMIFLVISIYQTIAFKEFFGTGAGYSMIWLIFMYIYGAYIRKYGVFENKSNKVLMLYYLAFTLIVTLSYIGFTYINLNLGGNISNPKVLVNYISPFIILNGIFAVRIFKNFSINGNRLKNIIKAISRSDFWDIFNTCTSFSFFSTF